MRSAVRCAAVAMLGAACLAACASPSAVGAYAVADAAAPAPLPLRVPLRGVMAGIIDFSAYGLFQTATSDAPDDDDWTSAGYATINLIGAATLITIPGSGAKDREWVADPVWREFATRLQAASIDAGIAVKRKDRPTLLAASDRIAATCSSCHQHFRIDGRGLTDFASLQPPAVR